MTESRVHPALLRCGAGMVLLGIFMSSASSGLAELIIGFSHHVRESAVGVNGYFDVLRIAGKGWMESGEGLPWLGNYGLAVAAVVLSAMLLRGKGPAVRLVRRMR